MSIAPAETWALEPRRRRTSTFWNFRVCALSVLRMAEKALASSRFWQVWTLLAVLGTAFAGARLIAPTSRTRAHAPPPAVVVPKRSALRLPPASGPAPAPSVDPLLARLAVATTATERCALLERVKPSEDAQPTYAITAVLERAQFSSVRVCATQALGRQPTSEAQSFLLDLAEDPEPEVHRSALDALATRDPAARAAVVEATHSEDLELRVSAVKALLSAKRAEAYAAAALVLPLVEDAETLSSLIDALGQAGDPQALPTLEALVGNAERDSHLHAISALGELGVPSVAVRLEDLLETGSSEEFSTAAAALKKLSPERVSSKLRALLSSANRERQELAFSAILSLELPELSSIMRERLASGDAGGVNLVLHQLIRKPDPSFEADLIAIAERTDRRLQLTAMRALSELSTQSARAALQRLASSLPAAFVQRFLDQSSDDPEQTREQRIAALSRADKVEPNTLFELAQDASESAQRALIRYLDGHELEAGVWATVVQLAPPSTVQRIADTNANASAGGAKEGLIEGLSRRGDPAFKDTLRANLRGDPSLRNGALAALVGLGDDSIWPDVQRLTQSSDPSDRALAVQLLSGRPDAEASRELERMASDPEPQVKSSALHALQPRSPELVGRLAQSALRESAPEDRANLLLLLGDLKASLVRPVFELALHDADDSVAVQAIQSMTLLQGPTSAQALLALVNDSSRSQQVRSEAATSLRGLGGPLARANRTLLDSLSEPAGGEYVCNPN